MINQWRAFTAILLLGLMLLVGLILICSAGDNVAAITPAYVAFASGIVGLGAAYCAKSFGQHYANAKKKDDTNVKT